jgi:hypothetical protein
VVGDWDGNGTTTVGVYRPSTATWYLRNENSPGAPDIPPFAYGASYMKPVVGDWNGDGKWTVGVYDPSGNGAWLLRNRNTPGAPDVPPFAYGAPTWTPVAGLYTTNPPGGRIFWRRVGRARARHQSAPATSTTSSRRRWAG